MRHQVNPASAAMAAETSPVKAPASVLEMFWMPTSIPEPFSPSMTALACNPVGQMITSTFEASNLAPEKVLTKVSTSAFVLGLHFQLPPMQYLRPMLSKL